NGRALGFHPRYEGSIPFARFVRRPGYVVRCENGRTTPRAGAAGAGLVDQGDPGGATRLPVVGQPVGSRRAADRVATGRTDRTRQARTDARRRAVRGARTSASTRLPAGRSSPCTRTWNVVRGRLHAVLGGGRHDQ